LDGRRREFLSGIRQVGPSYFAMDTILEQITNGRVKSGMARLQAMLYERRQRSTADEWRRFVKDEVLRPPLRDVLHADPFTYRAFSKPRGYAGDAVMMDYIYGYRNSDAVSLPSTAAKIFEFATSTPAPQAVRFRRGVLAETIDDCAQHAGSPIEVVAIAAGHLRELDLSAAAKTGQAKVLALDQDEASLEQVTRDYSCYGVEAREASVRSILADRASIPACDLVYTAGLYDYLPDAAARRLTTLMFNALRPGGTLLIANFLPDILDAGYMESVMDWHLIYRTDDDMRSLIDEISASDVNRVDQFHDPFDNVTFLQMTKRSR
jgi:extracellular factor (EF) 3-hydroxypalmitic acid methyl ester biosynthesis protein